MDAQRSPSRPARSESHLHLIVGVVVVSLLRAADSPRSLSLAGAGQLVATNNISRARRQSLGARIGAADATTAAAA
jgi:hypothetical protein